MTECYTFDGCFWITITGLILGFLGMLVQYALRSKCSKCQICGCLSIERDTENEIEEEIVQLERNINPFPDRKEII